MYNPFLVYCRELAPGTVSFTGDRAQGDDSKHDLHYIFKLKTYGKCSKIWYKMTFGYQGLNLRNTCQNIKQTGKTQIRLLLKKQSALGLRCLFCTQLVFEFFEHLLYSFVFTVADPGFLEKGVHMYEGVGVRFADFLLFFLNIIWKWNNLVSVRPKYFIFIGYLRTGDGEGVWALDPPSEPPELPLDPPLV